MEKLHAQTSRDDRKDQNKDLLSSDYMLDMCPWPIPLLVSTILVRSTKFNNFNNSNNFNTLYFIILMIIILSLSIDCYHIRTNTKTREWYTLTVFPLYLTA